MDNLRVLVLFGGSELFGQERANIEVFRRLSELGLKARFVTSSKWGAKAIQPELSRQGFEWTVAPFGYQWGSFLLSKEFYFLFVNLWGVFATSWRVWREARKYRATHIYVPVWMYWVYSAAGILATGRPMIFRAGDQLPANSAFHRCMSRWLLHDAAYVVCNGLFLAEKFISLGLPQYKLRVIYNHPPQRMVSSHEALPEVLPGALIVVFVGQISKHKGAAVLVEAAKRILPNNRNVVFWLVGESTWENPLAEELKSNVAEAGFERQIQFLGYRKDVPEILRAAHVHVCPSLSDDPSPNVVMEAKTEGLPSVVFPVGGIPELIEHGVDGYICRERTAEALAEGIDYFVTDAATRCAAGEAARRSLEERFGKERFRREWADVFIATDNAAREPG